MSELSLGIKDLKAGQLQDGQIYHWALLRTWILSVFLVGCWTLSLGWLPSGFQDHCHNFGGCILCVSPLRK